MQNEEPVCMPEIQNTTMYYISNLVMKYNIKID